MESVCVVLVLVMVETPQPLDKRLPKGQAPPLCQAPPYGWCVQCVSISRTKSIKETCLYSPLGDNTPSLQLPFPTRQPITWWGVRGLDAVSPRPGHTQNASASRLFFAFPKTGCICVRVCVNALSVWPLSWILLAQCNVSTSTRRRVTRSVWPGLHLLTVCLSWVDRRFAWCNF